MLEHFLHPDCRQRQRWATRKNLVSFYTNIHQAKTYKKKKIKEFNSLIFIVYVLEKNETDASGFLYGFYLN